MLWTLKHILKTERGVRKLRETRFSAPSAERLHETHDHEPRARRRESGDARDGRARAALSAVLRVAYGKIKSRNQLQTAT
eukprot:scaffold86794_cov63-Phaeocystis_antarctica.AAC.1